MSYSETYYEFLEKGIFIVTADKSMFIPYDSITHVDTSYKGVGNPCIRIHHAPSKYTDSIDILYKTEEEKNIAMREFARNYQHVAKDPDVEISYAKRHIVDLSGRNVTRL